MKLVLNPEYGLYEKEGKPFCDSLQIAETFEKEHFHVLRDIHNAIETINKAAEKADDIKKINLSKFGLINFIEDTYKDSKNRKYPKYLLTKNGFTYIVTAYEGVDAAIFKVDYIERFEAMESFIKSLQAAKLERPAWTAAIMDAHDEPKHYHFSNEANMINRIVLGIDAKAFRRERGIKDGLSIRPYLNDLQIKAIENLQRIDIGLLEIGLNYEKRKETLTNSHKKRLLRIAS